MGTGEKAPRAERVLRQSSQTWGPAGTLQDRHEEDLDRLLVDSIRSLADRTGIQLCVTFTWQPWLDREGRALPVARREWRECREQGYDVLWWINPSARLFYFFARKPRETTTQQREALSRSLPAVTRLLAEELGVTHPLRSVRLAIEALSLQLPARGEEMDVAQTPSQRA